MDIKPIENYQEGDCLSFGGEIYHYLKTREKWSKDTGYLLHYIKKAKHLSNCDNPKQVNIEIEMFITRSIYKMDF